MIQELRRRGVATIVWVFLVTMGILGAFITNQVRREARVKQQFRTGDRKEPMPALFELEDMLRTIQESSGIFYPVAGRWPTGGNGERILAGGVGITDRAGAPVLYYLEEAQQSLISGQAALGKLIRHDLASGQSRVLAEHVREFVIFVAPHDPGTRVQELELRFSMGDGGSSAGQRYDTVRKFFLRSSRLGEIDWLVE